jgi:hypothetical protein
MGGPREYLGWGINKMEPTKTTGVTTNDSTIHSGEHSQFRAYQKPNIRVMDEKEILSAFQVTVAGISWWV